VTETQSPEVRLPASFRDPSGFVFRRDGVLYRQVNESYRAEYEALKSSGLYDELVKDGLLIPASESQQGLQPGVVAVLCPDLVPTISYPYEWSFSQLKDAALTTLEIQKRALARGMVLKDASAYNIQYFDGKPLLIDTLSFDIYSEGEPWIAYRQFCRHFLAPLALAAHVDIRLVALNRVHIDGIPLDLASRLLPLNTKLKPGLLAHIHLHAKADMAQGGKPGDSNTPARISKTAILGLIDSLGATVRSLQWAATGTEWADYYSDTNYSTAAMTSKHALVGQAISKIEPPPGECWDLGANNGEFSRIAAARGIRTVAWDVDPAAVEKAYLAVRGGIEPLILPLLQDLTNPSGSIGWASEERDSLLQRGPVDLVMALALIHHLAIGNNLPLAMVAEFLAKCGRWAIVEFVPKQDSQVQRLMVSRKDIFDDYSREGWEAALASHFSIVSREDVAESLRTIYLLRRL
jgi:ribosomal protein L11 methylase PrmA